MLDLKSETGRAALTELVRRSDVLLENFRPGVLDRLGFHAWQRMTELNPALVVLSISGFGHDGPEGGRAGYDQIAQGEAGLMSMTGPDPETPTKVGRADLRPAGRDVRRVRGCRQAARAGPHRPGRPGPDVAAGQRRRRARLPGHPLDGGRRDPEGRGPASPVDLPYGLFHSADGIVQIAVGSRGAVGAVRPRVRHPGGRGRSSPPTPTGCGTRAVVRAAVEKAFAGYSTAELLAKLAEIGVPSGEVKNLQQVYDWDQTRSQGLLIDVEHPVLGAIQLPGPPLRFFEPSGDGMAPGAHRSAAARPAHRRGAAAGWRGPRPVRKVEPRPRPRDRRPLGSPHC